MDAPRPLNAGPHIQKWQSADGGQPPANQSTASRSFPVGAAMARSGCGGRHDPTRMDSIRGVFTCISPSISIIWMRKEGKERLIGSRPAHSLRQLNFHKQSNRNSLHLSVTGNYRCVVWEPVGKIPFIHLIFKFEKWWLGGWMLLLSLLPAAHGVISFIPVPIETILWFKLPERIFWNFPYHALVEKSTKMSPFTCYSNLKARAGTAQRRRFFQRRFLPFSIL